MPISVNILIIIATVLISFGAFSNQQLMNRLIFHPPAVSQRNQWYRFFSSGLIHADMGHLFFNMFSLYLFGDFVEKVFGKIFGSLGSVMYLTMYVAALLASLLPTYIKNKNNEDYYGLGASGAVSAVVFAGLLIAPYMEVGVFIIPPIIPGFVFAPLYLIFSIYLEKKGGGNINHSAHIWGSLFGLAFVIVVGKLLANYDAIPAFIDGVKYYFKNKGLIK